MKKVIIIAALAIASFANAQEIKSSKGEAYLPASGDWAISFNADGIFRYVGNSLNGNTNNGVPYVDYVQNNAFVGKLFKSDKTAYRVVANLGVNSTSNTAASGAANTQENSQSGFNVAAGLGKEWRKGKTRLQGFYGADALLTLNSSTSESVITNSTTGAFVSSNKVENGTRFGLAVQGFLGAEYFIFPKFSIGAQYTYRVGFDFNGKSERTSQVGTAPAVTTDLGKSSNFGLGNVGVSTINLTLHF